MLTPRSSILPLPASLSPSKSKSSFFFPAQPSLHIFLFRPRTTLTLKLNSLPEAKDDRALEAAVTRVFSQFGTVFVKIRREMKGTSNGMPYAFAQYTVVFFPSWSRQNCRR